MGNIVVALTSVMVLGCGGKGERLKPNPVVATDGGEAIDPCNLSATLITELIGCPGDPDKLAVASTRIYCPNWEHGSPSDGHTDCDPVPLTTNLPNVNVFGETADGCKNAPAGTACIFPYVDPANNLSGGDMSASLIPEGEGHCGTGTHAYHMVARGEFRWGPSAYIQYEYTPFPNAGIDISEWEGLSFWIKKGPEPTGETAFVSLFDKPTNGELEDSKGILCQTAPLAPDPVKCDQFGFSIKFDSDWQYMLLPFSELRQRGFGVHEDSVDLQHIIQLKFGFDIGDWDVWIDDVSLYQHK